jgi:hypothetical protein
LSGVRHSRKCVAFIKLLPSFFIVPDTKLDQHFFDVLIGNNQFVVKITKTMLTSPKANLIGDVSLKFLNVVACYLQWRNCSIYSLQTHRTFKFKGCIALHSKFEATKKEREKVLTRLQFSEVRGVHVSGVPGPLKPEPAPNMMLNFN